MKRRDFNKVIGAVAVSLAAGARSMAQSDTKKTDAPKTDAKKADDKAPKHVCKGMNDCKGQGGGDASVAGKNSCKGLGGCATTAKHDCRGKNECKGQGGCGTKEAGCQGKNDCKGKGGCAVPIKPEMVKKPAK